MPADYKRSFERLVAARERLVALRGERIGALLRLRMHLRARLGDFLGNVDPVSGMRLAELGAEGSKAYGDLALTLAFFEGSRLRVAVEKSGHFRHAAVPDVFAGIGHLVDVRVSPDLANADVAYVGAEDGALQTTDFGTFLDPLVEHVVASMEAHVDRPERPAGGEPPKRAGLTMRVR